MDYFSPGIRELRRIATRLHARWHLRGENAVLAKHETELGLLGWQQADFDPETQREVDKILKFEREQSNLTNEGAAHAREIAELKSQREHAQAAFEEKHAPLVAERKAHRESIEKIEAQLPPLRSEAADLENREPHLDRESREASRLYNDLLATEPQTPELRAQQTKLRERITSMPSQIAEIQLRRARLLREIEELEKSLALENEGERTCARHLREMESTHSTDDRKLADTIAAKERARQKIDLESTRLEKQKSNPYREIGRVLADSHLPPMNQPQALEAVRASRLRVQELEYTIAKSRADSDAEDRTLTQNSLFLLGAVALAVLLVLGALIHW